MKKSRLLIYSHDSYGLGHLRRCRTIAHSLVDYFEDLSVLIVSGSPIIGSYNFHPRVDFVRIPGVVKLDSGKYTSLNPGIGLDELIEMRSSLLLQSAVIYEPDVFLVDKEPLGLRGEVQPTLKMLKAKGASLVLGIRDIMDDPKMLAEEWERKNALPALEELYDHIWIYGLPEMCDPLEGLPIQSSISRKISYTGYLRRASTTSSMNQHAFDPADEEPYILVTTGGGGDGAQLIDWVLRAYEDDPDIPHPAKLILGPFMNVGQQTGFMDRVNQLDKVSAITFDADIETLMENAVGVVSMGGYNIFCELLSFDKKGLIVPRTVPRMEQYIRASRAEELGLIKMLMLEDNPDSKPMADALHGLQHQPKPSDVHIPGLLGGLPAIISMMDEYLQKDTETQAPFAVVG